MGSHTVRYLARSREVEVLTIAGRNLAKAQRLAEEVGPPARAVSVDATDQPALIELLRQHDVVANALGPFYLFEVPVARAAIAAGTHYVSICDDYDAAEAVLGLDEEARNRGVTIVTGAGWTPGLTNLLALKGMQQLEETDEVHIAWAAAFAGVEGFASIPHTIHAFTGSVPTYEDGTRKLVRAGSGKQVVYFPDPLGPVTVYHCGHPEPVTLPHFVPGLKTVTLRGGVVEGLLNSVVMILARMNAMRDHRRRERVLKALRPLAAGLTRVLWPRVSPLAGAHVRLHGRHAGRQAEITMAVTGRMGELTGIPHAVITLMVGRGEVSRPGVIAPEAKGGPDPDRFLREVEARGLAIHIGPVQYTGEARQLASERQRRDPPGIS